MEGDCASEFLGGVELGGTKTVVAVGRIGAGRVAEPVVEERFPTGGPEVTLARVAGFFAEQAAAGHRAGALGVAAFGPVELRRASPRWGCVGATPKPGWTGTDVAGALGRALGVPVAIDTDVNAAALAEGCLGAATGLASFVYLTVGTGIGGGAVVDGRTVHGLVHPEIGHVSVPRLAGDGYPGCCPFHGDCLEGMASGPALAARCGRPAEELTGAAAAEAARIAAWYLAAGLRNVVYALAPQRIVVGGGVAALPGLFPLLRRALAAQLAGYPGLPEHAAPGFVVPAALGRRAGVVGALLLAAEAAAPAAAAVPRA